MIDAQTIIQQAVTVQTLGGDRRPFYFYPGDSGPRVSRSIASVPIGRYYLTLTVGDLSIMSPTELRDEVAEVVYYTRSGA